MSLKKKLSLFVGKNQRLINNYYNLARWNTRIYLHVNIYITLFKKAWNEKLSMSI